MKNRLVRSLFSLLLVALLVTALLPVTALAYIELTYTVELANGIDEEIHSPDGSWIDDVVLVSGELPYGVAFGHKEDYMYLIGVPAFAGTYEARLDMEIGGGAYQYLIRIVVKDPNAPVTVTKHPTGETVNEGGSALFIARADNATEIIWRLVSPDGYTSYNCSDAPSYFPGLQVVGLGTESLSLLNIPYALNGWKVEAKFNGKDGPVFSHGAAITVIRSVLQEPVISVQPRGMDLEQGKTAELSVVASAPQGSLCYQWYRADTDYSPGIAISGANSASLTVTDSMGSGYYYVGIWCVDGERASPLLLSNIAVVRFTQPAAAPVVTPEQPGQTDPGQTPGQADPGQTPAQTDPTQGAVPPAAPAAAKDNSNLLLILCAVGCTAALGVCIIMIIKTRRRS